MAYQRSEQFDAELQELFDTALREGVHTLRDVAKNSDDDDVRAKAAKTLVDAWKDYNGVGQQKALPGAQTNNLQINIQGLKGTLEAFTRQARKADPEAARLVGEVAGELSVLESAVKETIQEQEAPFYRASPADAVAPPPTPAKVYVVPDPEEALIRRQKLKETLAARGFQDFLSEVELLEEEGAPLGQPLNVGSRVGDRLEDDWPEEEWELGEGEGSDE